MPVAGIGPGMHVSYFLLKCSHQFNNTGCYMYFMSYFIFTFNKAGVRLQAYDAAALALTLQSNKGVTSVSLQNSGDTMITDKHCQPPRSVLPPSSNGFSRETVRVLWRQREQIGKNKGGCAKVFHGEEVENWKGSASMEEWAAEYIKQRKGKQMTRNERLGWFPCTFKSLSRLT